MQSFDEGWLSHWMEAAKGGQLATEAPTSYPKAMLGFLRTMKDMKRGGICLPGFVRLFALVISLSLVTQTLVVSTDAAPRHDLQAATFVTGSGTGGGTIPACGLDCPCHSWSRFEEPYLVASALPLRHSKGVKYLVSVEVLRSVTSGPLPRPPRA
jgi:hypothetical protein